MSAVQLDWFHSFIETVHTSSLSKAGEKLNISQTALSKHIKNLEEGFGVILFHRSASGMELTPEGRLLYDKVTRWLADIDETKRELRNLASIRHVILGTLPSLAARYVPEKALRLKADGVEVNIAVFNTSKDVLDAFVDGRIDVAILDRNLSIPKLYPVADLFTEPYYAVVPNGHPLGRAASVHVADITQEPLIMYPPQCDVRRSLESALVQHDATLKIAAEVPFGEAILGFVAAGAGMTIVPETIANHLADTTLAVVPIVDLEMTRVISVVAKSSEQLQFLYRYLTRRLERPSSTE